MWESIHDISGWMNHAIALVARYPDWALGVAFLAAIIEALAIVGMIIPGTFIVMGVAGAAAAAGQPMIPFLVLAIAGAVIGDFLSYWLGFRYRRTIRDWRVLASRPHIMASADRFFERYGSYSVALCRFLPVFRSMVPLIAGTAGMPRKKFLIANVTSAFIWAPAHVCPAQLAGLSLDRMRAGDWESASWFGGAMVLCAAAIWALHKRLTPILLAARR